ADRVRVLRAEVGLGSMGLRLEVVRDDVAASVAGGLVDLELAVEPAGPHEGRVQDVRTVRRADDEDDGLRRHRAADEAEPAPELVAPAVFDMLAERANRV